MGVVASGRGCIEGDNDESVYCCVCAEVWYSGSEPVYRTLCIMYRPCCIIL